MSTNIVKWNDTDNRLTAYCDDDKTKTEIGPAKWSDANNRLEIHCNSEVFPVKWNNATNRLEAQNVSAGCCCDLENCCCENSIDVTFSSITDCGNRTTDCTIINGNTYTLTYQGKDSTKCTWAYNNTGVLYIYLEWYHSNGYLNEGTIRIYTTQYSDRPSGPYTHCFCGVSSGNNICSDIPLNISSSLVVGDCGTVGTGYCMWGAGNEIEGYGGSVYIEWT